MTSSLQWLKQRLFSSPASPPGTPVIVDIYARTGRGGGVAFSHEWGWEDGLIAGNGRIDIPEKNKHEPGTPIHFHLHDLTRPRRGLVFSDDGGGAMWVDRNRCPPSDEPCGDAQIPEDRINRAAKLLRVFDLNSERCDLHYRLRLQDRDGNPESYDPDIRNGGNT